MRGIGFEKKTFNKNALEHIDGDDDVASPLLRGSAVATGQGRLRALNVAAPVRSSSLLGIERSDVAAKIGGRTRSRVSVKEVGLHHAHGVNDHFLLWDCRGLNLYQREMSMFSHGPQQNRSQ